jgi:hypothetical protein
MQAFEKREVARRAAAVVGIDAGKFQHAMVIRPRGGADSRPFLFPTTRTGFEQAIRAMHAAADGIDGELLVGIEFAGMYGFTFAHYLNSSDGCGWPAPQDSLHDRRASCIRQ